MQRCQLPLQNYNVDVGDIKMSGSWLELTGVLFARGKCDENEKQRKKTDDEYVEYWNQQTILYCIILIMYCTVKNCYSINRRHEGLIS